MSEVTRGYEGTSSGRILRRLLSIFNCWVAVRALAPRPRLEKRAMIGIILLSLVAGCSPPSDSPLRKELDRLDATRNSKVLNVTNAVQPYIALGIPESQAVDALSKAGFQQKRRDKESVADSRCPYEYSAQPGPRASCPDPKNKSDYYLAFEAGAGNRYLYFWTVYYVEIGVRDGLVDFVASLIRTDCIFCP